MGGRDRFKFMFYKRALIPFSLMWNNYFYDFEIFIVILNCEFYFGFGKDKTN